jgi:branched-chain amino acid transport system substrate-binding protein
MEMRGWMAAVAIGVLVSVAPPVGASVAQAQVKIGVMVSSTGPGSIVGVPQKNSAQLLPQKVGNLSVNYFVLDDGGDPTTTVSNVKKLLLEDHVDGLIGPSLSPCAMAILEFVAESKVPLIAAVGTDAVIKPMDDKRRWIFKTAQANSLILTVLVEHMRQQGIKTLGLMRLADALGEEWARALTPLIDAARIKLVADERFQRADTSVVAQTLHLLAAKPDAVLIAAAGASAVLADVSLREKGYEGAVYETNGAATDDFPRLGGEQVEGTLMAAGPLQVVDDLAGDNPIKRVALGYIARYQTAFGVRPSTFGSNVYDAGLILERALPIAAQRAKPGTPEFRAALRDAIEQTKNVVGTQGVFNMSPTDHNGMDTRATLMMVVRDGKWRLLTAKP